MKLRKTRASKLPGLDRVIPIEPKITTIKFAVDEGGQVVHRLGQRCQFPITAAYAFTDYKVQGQTIPQVIVDIACPLSLFNVYVALSRSSGQSTIRLLKDFEEDVF